MRGRMAGSTAQGSLFEAIRTHTRGAGHMGRCRGGELACTGRRWFASLIHLQRARPRRPVPLFIVHGDSRSASRPPCTLAVAPAIFKFVSASDFAPQSRPEALASWHASLPVILGRARRYGIAGRLDEGESAMPSKEAASKAGDPAQESSKTQNIRAYGDFCAGSPNGSFPRRSRMTGPSMQKLSYWASPLARPGTQGRI
jgi:hypothetical protein